MIFRRHRPASAAQRSQRLPTLKDIEHDFGAQIFRSLGKIHRSISKGYVGAQEAWSIIDSASHAEQLLADQSYAEGSDLYILRVASWAAYDLAQELNELDRQLDQAAGGQLTKLLVVCLDEICAGGRRRASDDYHRREISSWVKRLQDPAAKAWYQQKLSEREAVVTEALVGADAIHTFAVRAAWMASCPKIEQLSESVREPLRQLRREQIAQADVLTRALSEAIAETVGLELPGELQTDSATTAGQPASWRKRLAAVIPSS